MKYLILLLIPIFGFSQNDSLSNCDYDTTNIFHIVDEFPEFEGGEEELLRYLNENAPKSSEFGLNMEYLYIVQIVVHEDGTFSDICFVRSIGPSILHPEIVKMILKMPKWKPAKKNGQIVKSSYRIPIRIRCG